MSSSVLSISVAPRYHVTFCQSDSADGLCAFAEQWSSQRGLP
jgi:hypothetical protein